MCCTMSSYLEKYEQLDGAHVRIAEPSWFFACNFLLPMNLHQRHICICKNEELSLHQR